MRILKSDCKYFRWKKIYSLDLIADRIEPAKTCCSPNKCTEPCVENSDFRYRVVTRDEIEGYNRL